MKQFTEQIKKYAEVIAKVGLNVQPGETVVVLSDVRALDLVRAFTTASYELGAKKVIVELSDSTLQQDHMKYQSIETIEDLPPYLKVKNDYYLQEKVSMLFIHATSPESLKDAAPEKLAAANRAGREVSKELSDSRMRHDQPWCIVGYPGPEWAKLVFPDLAEEEAVAELMENILKTVRVDQEDPVAAWNAHGDFLKSRAKWLSDFNFDRLKYTAPGTDLEIGLIDGSQFAGGGHKSRGNLDIKVNMPTEEVFTSPDYRRVNGVVSNTLPLSYAGQIIDHFKLTFKDGVVTDFEAEQGFDALRELLDTDEGARRLGEAALVPVDSPISNSGILYYNTLFDENASCHVALGKAYPGPVPGANEMTEEERDAVGLNSSLTHVDFMIGSKELDIDGITRDGKVVPVFRQGNWVE
ncbi:aminopeptidase [Macrococcus equipercicus]|uniref:Aminopeptidase n=1 Tax=Macrococcus equipercicus TaxID=69967 RepID=A0A9Q9F288_9STAP|nr:aminopeptidase [Macrococcus equipercicus]KAA1037613.1 aminopeptidase [Macrococcus equipercicus]UTH14126.1 aminopeptidase [Macrococcus equipercicus]